MITPITTLIIALKEDSDYRRTWVANLSVQFQDEFRRIPIESITSSISNELLKHTADRAANNFIDLLIKQANG